MAVVERGRSRRRTVDDVEQLMKTCCREGARALVTIESPRCVFVAAFATIGESTVHLRIDEPVEEAPRSGSLCSVQFFRGDRAHVFLSHVFSFTQDYVGTSTFGLILPDEILQKEARRSFRVPLADSIAGLAVRVRHDAGEWVPVKLVDLSRGGLRVATGRTELPDGEQWMVNIEEIDGALQLPARVVRRADSYVALAFVPGPELERAEGLVRLVGQLERAWLRKRRQRGVEGA